MTSGLRRAHRYIWLILTIVIPIMIVLSIKDLKFSNGIVEESFETGVVQEKAIGNFENDLIKVALYPNSIDLILKKSLKQAACTVYAIDGEEKKMVIGQLTTSGKYQFAVDEVPKNIMIYDDIKDGLITKTNF